MKKYELHKWIGLAEVVSKNDLGQKLLSGNTRGFVNVIALAHSKYSFRKIVKETLDYYNLKLIKLEESEEFSKRESKYELDLDIKELSNNINEENRIGFGDFFVY